MIWLGEAIRRVYREKPPLIFLNRIQKVGYRVNPFTLNVAEWLDGISESGIAATLALGSETPQANADVTEATTPVIRSL